MGLSLSAHCTGRESTVFHWELRTPKFEVEGDHNSSWFGIATKTARPRRGDGWERGVKNIKKKGKGATGFPLVQFYRLICTPVQHQCQLLLRKF